MIGIFDSGFGLLQTLKYFKNKLPEYNYIFLADSKNVPYGNKTPEEIKKLTYKGLHWLFDNGAKIVILACNTASAFAIKSWQEDFPDKKVLSVTIPAIEKISKLKYKNIGLLATKATIKSKIYNKKTAEIIGKNIDYKIHSISAGKLVDFIESGDFDSKELENYIFNLLQKFPENLEVLVLGCTHFPILMKAFKKFTSSKIKIINPSLESANKFVKYLEKHKEIETKLSRGNEIKFFVTGDRLEFGKIGREIWGKSIEIENKYSFSEIGK